MIAIVVDEENVMNISPDVTDVFEFVLQHLFLHLHATLNSHRVP